jgi:hypothetical protein
MEVYSLSFYSAIAPRWKADMSIMPVIKKNLMYVCSIMCNTFDKKNEKSITR